MIYKSSDIDTQKHLEHRTQFEAIYQIVRCCEIKVFDEQKAYSLIRDICWSMSESLSMEIHNKSFINIQIESDKING